MFRGPVTHSFRGDFCNRHPFNPVRDLEHDESGAPIGHGRFHTVAGDRRYDRMAPAEADPFATLTKPCERARGDGGILPLPRARRSGGLILP